MGNIKPLESGEREPVPTSLGEKGKEQEPIYHEGDRQTDDQGNEWEYSGVSGWKKTDKGLF